MVTTGVPRTVISFGWAHCGQADIARKFVDAVASTEAWAIKVSKRHAASYFVSSRLGQLAYGEQGRMTFEACCEGRELSVEALASVRSHAAGRLRFGIAVHDETALGQALSVSPDLISIEAAAACNRALVRKAAEARVPVVVEVNWLGSEEQGELDRLFGPDQLILAWREGSDIASLQDGLEDLFALKNLLQQGRPVAFVGSMVRQSSLILAMGFGASVLEVNFDSSQVGAAGEAENVAVVTGVSALLTEVRRFGEMDPTSVRVPASPEVMDLEDRTRLAIVASRDIPKGAMLTADMLAVKAPYGGVSPGLMPRIVGGRVLYDIPKDAPVTFGFLDL